MSTRFFFVVPIRAASICTGTFLVVAIRTILVVTILTVLFSHDHDRVILRSELFDRGVHVVVHPACQVILDDLGDEGYRGIEFDVRIKVEEVAEDA